MIELAISGIGITAATGQGKAEVQQALLRGAHAFGVMSRPGRQNGDSAFAGAEIQCVRLPEGVPAKVLRTASWSAQVALATVAEAWLEAGLDAVDPVRIGLVAGGSNLQQRELVLMQDRYRDRYQFLRPTYGQVFMDTDIAALCSEQFGIRGVAHTVGAASASGQLAIIEAARAVRAGEVEACIAVGALMDLSYWECQGLRSLGAMGSDRYADDPAAACRPFDRGRDGFIFGESCGAVVIEPLPAVRSTPYATIEGWSYAVDGHRNPDPPLDGEIRAIQTALEAAGWQARDVDYVNPHGTGAVIGDDIELTALRACGLSGVHLNATKSLLGHGLSAAGAVEVVATLLQMRTGYLHPTRNLDEPIDPSFAWVREDAVPHEIERALNLSFGFGGINTAVCLRNCRK